jgi:hypothetical protein
MVYMYVVSMHSHLCKWSLLLSNHLSIHVGMTATLLKKYGWATHVVALGSGNILLDGQYCPEMGGQLANVAVSHKMAEKLLGTSAVQDMPTRMSPFLFLPETDCKMTLRFTLQGMLTF